MFAFYLLQLMSPSEGGPSDTSTDMPDEPKFIKKPTKDIKAYDEKSGDGDELWTWDYVLVFKRLKENQKRFEKFRVKTAEYEAKIKKAKLKVTTYRSVQDDEIYFLVGATEKRLRWEADRRDYDVLLNDDEVVAQGKEKKMALAQVAESEKEEDSLAHRRNWRRMYGKYNRFPEGDKRQKLFAKPPQEDPVRHPDTAFRSIDRLRLTYLIFTEEQRFHGAGLKVENNLASGRKGKHPLVAVFPAHERQKKQELQEKWVRLWPLFDQPLDEIRDYFGEKVAFYFAFLQTYCRWLVFPSLVGFILFFWQVGENRVDIDVLPFFGLGMALWATLFLEFWKRREAELRCDWGMTNYESQEGTRPEFTGSDVRSPVTGKWIRHFPPRWRVCRLFTSQSVVGCLICVVLGCVVSIFFLRTYLSDKDKNLGTYVTAIINAIQIQILNYVYALIANILNEYENHRTPSEFENALIVKTFLFKFINSYNSLFYIAFFKRYETACPDGTCMEELRIQLGILFGVAIFVSNAIEIGVPYLKTKLNAYLNRNVTDRVAKTEKPKTDLELEFELEPYTTLTDFDEMVIQFGYVSLFVVAFPLAPLGALLNNYVEIRLDASKLCQLCQRPRPLGATGIGTFFDILTIVSYIAVATNMVLVSFGTSIITTWSDGDGFKKAWIFFISEHVIIIFKVFIAYAINDVSQNVQESIDRQAYVVDVLIDEMPEEPDELLEDDNKDDDDAKVEAGFTGWKYETISDTPPPAWATK